MCKINKLTSVPCASNPAGTKLVGYVIPASEITAMPAYLTTTTEGDTVKVSTAFTLTTDVGKGYWRSFPMLINENSYDVNLVGGTGSKSFEEGFTFRLQGLDAAQLEFVSDLKNVPSVFVVEDKKGVKHVIGRSDDPAFVDTGEGSTGKAATDARGFTITVKGVTDKPMVYEGPALDVTPN